MKMMVEMGYWFLDEDDGGEGFLVFSF